MSYLRDPFWQFVISTIIAVAGIIIPLIIGAVQARKSRSPGPPQWQPSAHSSGHSSGCWVIPVVGISLLLIILVIFFTTIFTFISGTLSRFSGINIGSVASLTSSTPDDALNTFCHSIQSGAYQEAYDEYSSNLKAQVSSSEFIDMWSDQNLEACTHDTINTSGNQASTTLTTRNFFTHEARSYNVTLVQEADKSWRIDSLEPA